MSLNALSVCPKQSYLLAITSPTNVFPSCSNHLGGMGLNRSVAVWEQSVSSKEPGSSLHRLARVTAQQATVGGGNFRLPRP